MKFHRACTGVFVFIASPIKNGFQEERLLEAANVALA